MVCVAMEAKDDLKLVSGSADSYWSLLIIKLSRRYLPRNISRARIRLCRATGNPELEWTSYLKRFQSYDSNQKKTL